MQFEHLFTITWKLEVDANITRTRIAVVFPSQIFQLQTVYNRTTDVSINNNTIYNVTVQFTTCPALIQLSYTIGTVFNPSGTLIICIILSTGRCPLINSSNHLSVVQYEINQEEYVAHIKCSLSDNNTIAVVCGMNNAWNMDLKNLCSLHEHTIGII